MGRIADVRQAFEERLSDFPNSPPIAWENVKYTPTIGVTYLEPTLIPSSSSHITLQGYQRNEGIFQINIYAPAEKGSYEIMTLADSLYDHFANRDLSVNNTKVWLSQIETNQATRIDSWYVITVSIFYHSYST